MVRPYLPRFLREENQAEIKVVVNNAATKSFGARSSLTSSIPATEQSVLSQFQPIKIQMPMEKAFTVPASGRKRIFFPDHDSVQSWPDCL